MISSKLPIAKVPAAYFLVTETPACHVLPESGHSSRLPDDMHACICIRKAHPKVKDRSELENLRNFRSSTCFFASNHGRVCSALGDVPCESKRIIRSDGCHRQTSALAPEHRISGFDSLPADRILCISAHLLLSGEENSFIDCKSTPRCWGSCFRLFPQRHWAGSAAVNHQPLH
jgi:hypothetical protein